MAALWVQDQERRPDPDRADRPAQAVGRALRADRGAKPVQDSAARQSGRSCRCRCCAPIQPPLRPPARLGGARLAPLPRPLTAVLVGGRTKPFRFDAAVAATLLAGSRSSRRATAAPSTSRTSRRTQPRWSRRWRAGCRPGALLYRWTADTQDDNPYLALLAWPTASSSPATASR